MDFQTRIDAVFKSLDDLSRRETLDIIQKGQLDTVKQQLAFARIKRSKDSCKEIIDSLPKPGPGGLDPTQQAVTDCALSYIEMVIANSPSADMRAVQFHSYGELASDHKQAIDEANKSGLTELANLTDQIGEAAKILRKAVQNPKAFVSALALWNRFVRPDPGLKPFQILPKYVNLQDDLEKLVGDDHFFAIAFQDYSAQVPQQQVKGVLSALQLTAKDLVVAAKWLGAAATLLSITTLVLNTLGDEKQWAMALAKSSFSIGVPLLLSAIITDVTVVPVVNIIAAGISGAGSLFTGAAVTIEVPPVAFVLFSVGLCIGVGIALAELFDFLLDTLFGGPIPRSMRAEMAVPMAASMRRQMAMPMSAPYN